MVNKKQKFLEFGFDLQEEKQKQDLSKKKCLDNRKIISEVSFFEKTGISYFDNESIFTQDEDFEFVENNEEFGITWNTDFACNSCGSIIPDRILFFCSHCSSKFRTFYCEICLTECPECDILLCNSCAESTNGFIFCDGDDCEVVFNCPFHSSKSEEIFKCSLCIKNGNTKANYCEDCITNCEECIKNKFCNSCGEDDKNCCSSCSNSLCVNCQFFCENCNCLFCLDCDQENHHCK